MPSGIEQDARRRGARGSRLAERSSKIPGGLIGGMERAAATYHKGQLFGAIGSGMAQSSNVGRNKPELNIKKK